MPIKIANMIPIEIKASFRIRLLNSSNLLLNLYSGKNLIVEEVSHVEATRDKMDTVEITIL